MENSINLKKIKYVLPALPLLLPFFIILIIIMSVSVSSSSRENIITNSFAIPFSDDIEYSITSEFGYRIDPISGEIDSFHRGIDLSAPMGTNILASANGIVVDVSYGEELGQYIIIEHIIDGMNYQTVYAHLELGSQFVSSGEEVLQGQPIAIIGNTGWSTGTHLHFEIHTPKRTMNIETAIDPIIIFNMSEQ